MCPQCGSEQLRPTRYDYGRDPETGYHDCGVRVVCLDCGAVSDAEEVDRHVKQVLIQEAKDDQWPEMPVLKPITRKVVVPNIPEWEVA